MHDTRHTCASLLAALDVHPRIAMQILRHSEIAVTMEVYTHVPSADTRRALRKLGKALGGGKQKKEKKGKRKQREREEEPPDKTASKSHSGCCTPLLYARQRPIHDHVNGPLTCVGVAGFEPTTSSSRIRLWKIANLGFMPKIQVRASGCVGLRWYHRAVIARSSPGFLHGGMGRLPGFALSVHPRCG
ncbi:hypothetical protein ACGFNV_23055 [Streptomyces sp. NPDC048751]|uniref:hypothetical protein n=1 Tax=Streptomyces sp. NPDC048751 TaxID=3365591 RepID=UPI00370FA18E